jgi:hypothetical protein
MAKLWMGTRPVTCDICSGRITKTFVDGKTKMGPWGILCLSCHKSKGCGLGLGKGQRYELKEAEFVKVEG